MYSGNDLKVGKKFIMEGSPYEVLSYAQKVMGRGGSIINIKAKNLINGSNISKTFSDNDKFEPADIETNSYDYLYNDGINYYFMNQSTYEQVELSKESLGGSELFLNDGDKVSLQEFNGTPININLEPSVILKVIDTPPGEKGDTATGGKKPATMSTGLVVQVPLFIKIGENIKIDTRTKEYLGRC
ncbi:elongation factor P [Candidatus Gracilibacteria bacterium]|nr:MAG: elongation factor P [Candidatus Gracilibacteria bacterium]PIE85714.1 MAG: elongation factor P [Candidatus Gracilibacteria bacterium]